MPLAVPFAFINSSPNSSWQFKKKRSLFTSLNSFSGQVRSGQNPECRPVGVNEGIPETGSRLSLSGEEFLATQWTKVDSLR